MRPVWKPGDGGPNPPLGAGSARGSPRISSWSASRSLPAAWATSSRKLWNAYARALLPGARIGPVGRLLGNADIPMVTCSRNCAGNSVALMVPLLVNLSPTPNVTM